MQRSNKLIHRLMAKHDAVCIRAEQFTWQPKIGESVEEFIKRVETQEQIFKGRDIRMLNTELKMKHYSIFAPEVFFKTIGEQHYNEASRIVVNINDDSDFLETMLRLALDYYQEEILYIKEGSEFGYWLRYDRAKEIYEQVESGKVYIGGFEVNDVENEYNAYILKGYCYSIDESISYNDVQYLKQMKEKNIYRVSYD